MKINLFRHSCTSCAWKIRCKNMVFHFLIWIGHEKTTMNPFMNMKVVGSKMVFWELNCIVLINFKYKHT